MNLRDLPNLAKEYRDAHPALSNTTCQHEYGPSRIAERKYGQVLYLRDCTRCPNYDCAAVSENIVGAPISQDPNFPFMFRG